MSKLDSRVIGISGEHRDGGEIGHGAGEGCGDGAVAGGEAGGHSREGGVGEDGVGVRVREDRGGCGVG